MNAMKRKKDRIKFVVCCFLMAFIGVIVFDGWRKLPFDQEKVLSIGVFSDSYWEVQNGYSYQIMDDAIALFEQEHPGIHIRYESGIMKADYSEWLAQRLLLGEAPDLFFVMGDDFNNFAEIGALANLQVLAQKDPSFDPSVYYPSVYEYGKYEKILYALPYECTPRLMFVNKSILDAEGILMPDKDWTWEDFYEICQKVTKDRNHNGILDQYGAVGYSWRDAFDSNGVSVFNRQGTECRLTGENVVEAIRFLERMEQLNDGYNVTSRDFTLGNVAFQPLLFSEYRAYKSYPLSIKKYSGFDWDCMTMPAGPSGENMSRMYVLPIAMNARTEHLEESWEFMKFLTQDERVQAKIFDYSEGISVLPGVTESEYTYEILTSHNGGDSPFNMQILKDAMEEAVVAPRFHGYDLAVEEVGKAVSDIVNGDSNINMELIIQNRNLNNYLQGLKQH